MILQNEQPADKGQGTDAPEVDALPTVRRAGPVLVPDETFYQGVAVGHPGGVQAVVTAGRNGAPNDHNWCKPDTDFAPWATEKVKDRNPGYTHFVIHKSESDSWQLQLTLLSR